jgi:hypothetical protein
MLDNMEKKKVERRMVIEQDGSRRDRRYRNLIFTVPLFFLGWSWADESRAVQSTHMETHLQNLIT